MTSTAAIETSIDSVAQAWRDHAPRLAEWIDDHLVARRDVWGGYLPLKFRANGKSKSVTKPRKDKRGKVTLTRGIIEAHCRGNDVGDIIGLHPANQDNLCRSITIDIDKKKNDNANREMNEAAALRWWSKLRNRGFKPWLEDSNGNGAFHLTVIFAEPVGTAVAYEFCKWIVADWKEIGLTVCPEVFPKQPHIGPDEYGNWMRLPGRHHTEDHWSKFWNGEGWIEGAAACELILNTAADSIEFIPDEALPPEPEKQPESPARSNGELRRDDTAADRLSEIEIAERCLGHIPNNDLPYDQWLAIVAAANSVSSNGQVPRAANEWSRRSAKHDQQKFDSTWKTFKRSGGNVATLGTLVHLAKQNGLDVYEDRRQELRDRSRTASAGNPSGRPEIILGTDEHRVADGSVEPNPVETAPWPEPLAAEAFHGLAGEIVRAIEPHTEADIAALLIQFLVAFGNAGGRACYCVADSAKHYANLFAVLIGDTAKGRKGTSWGQVRRLFETAVPSWADGRVVEGLASGEGLIWAVRDKIVVRQPVKKSGRVVDYEEVETDPGISDKRLLVQEGEFAQCLKVLQRDGNTLSPVIRRAWDTGALRTLTKNSPASATDAHISIIGHITRDELRRRLDAIESVNGFANRFLWVCVRRSKCLPEGGQIDSVDFAPLVRRLAEAIEYANEKRLICRDDATRELWAQVYPDLSAGKPGLLGAVTTRAEAQVMRLAMIYALLDQSPWVRVEHLRASLAVWAYCDESAKFTFGWSLGDRVADEILSALRSTPGGMTRNDLRELFGRHRGSEEIASALAVLLKHGLARREEEATRGRTAERWFAALGPAPKAPKALKAEDSVQSNAGDMALKALIAQPVAASATAVVSREQGEL